MVATRSSYLLAAAGLVWASLAAAGRPETVPAANQAPNPSAEQIDERGRPVGWGHYQNTPDRWGATEGESHSGKRSAFLKITGFGEDAYACTALAVGRTDGYTGPEAIAVQPETTYHFAFSIAGYGFKRKITVQPWGFGADGSGRDRSVPGIKVLPTPQWQRYTGSFRTPPGIRRVALMFFVYSLHGRDVAEGATFYVDDVYLGTSPPPPVPTAGDGRIHVPPPPAQVRGEGYRPLKEGMVRIWDANRKYTMKHYDFRAWKDRANWSAVPYGPLDYRFRGECILEGKNFWLSLHASRYDSVFLYLKLDAEGTPSRHNEIYRVFDTPNGLRNYGSGSQLARIIKNEPGEIIIESQANTYTRGGFETTVTTQYRILAGKPWVEIRPVSQANEQGMHGETRILVAPEAGPDRNDWADDAARHPNGYTTHLPPHSKMLLDLALDIDAIWLMTWPDPAKARPRATDHHGGWPSGWQRIGEGDRAPVWTAPFANFGDGKRPVYIGALFKGYWMYQRVDQPVRAGQPIAGQWRWAHRRKIPGTPWKAGQPWYPMYPGRWRVIGCVDGRYYTNPIIVTRDQTGSSRFRFTSPVSGRLDYLIMYFYDRTEQTPEDVSTPMDIYRQTVLEGAQ